MPSVDEIRTLTIKAITDGMDQAVAQINKVSAAQGNLAVVSDTTTRATQSVAKAYENAQRSLDVNYRSSQQFNKTQLDLTRAYNEGLVSLDRYNQLSALNTQRLGQMSNAQQAVGAVMNDLNGRVAAATGSLGTMGQVLTAFGPAGIAVAAIVGTAVLALNGMADAAHALAQKAEELRRFSDITGLTTQQVQALRSEASKFGVSGDEATTAIERFTAGFNELRLGQGALLTQIRRVNPALADQMQMTTNAGDALTLFGKALAQVDDVFQRNALVKAATGKGGLVNAEFLTGLNVDKTTQSFNDLGRGIEENLIKKLPLVENQINKLKTSMGDAFTKQFALPLLEAELTILQTIKDISTALANVKLSDDFKAFLNFATMLPRLAINTALDPAASFRTPRVQGSADRNDPLRAAPYQAPLRTAGMADLNDPLRALPSTSKTLEAQVEDLKKLHDVLGAATTFTQQYNLSLSELELKAKNAGISQTDLTFQLAKGALGLDLAIRQTAALNGILGVSASIDQQLLARRQQIDKAQMEGAGATGAQVKAALDLERANKLGLTAMKAQSDALDVEVATMAMSVGTAAAYRLEHDRINQAKRDGQMLSAQELADLHAQAVATGDLVQSTEKLKIQFQINRDQKLALLSPEDVQIANQLKSIYPDIATALGSSEAAAIRFNNALVQAKADTVEFAQSFAKGMMDGKSFTDSLSAALKNLSAKLADRAILDLLSGNWEKAAIEGIAAIGTALASLVMPKGIDTKTINATNDRIAQLDQQRLSSIASSSGTLADQLGAFDHDAWMQRLAEVRAGGQAMGALEQSLATQREQIITDFNAKAVADDKAAADARLAAQNEINQRIQAAQDRLFAATNDPNTLQGQLDAFDRQAQRDREDEIAKGGQALVDLEAAQAAERYNVIKTFNDKITADAAATAKSVLDAQTKVATQIVDYLNNLNVGSGSSLSPQDRLSAAQTTFNATSSLAAGGNLDALGRFTTDAENLRKAAADFYASGAGYQSILATIKATATALPVVAGSNDPLVNAMLGVKTAVQTTTAAVTTDTTQTSARLDTSINKLDITADKMSTSVDLLRQIGQQEANVATGWYSRMVDQLVVIAASTKGVFDYQMEVAHRTPAPSPTNDNSWWNPLNWFQGGGVVGAYAPGGIVGNGLFNVDSVRARYAGGGDIALAGGEGIINAERTREMGGASAINMLNRGMMPVAANSNWRGGGAGNGDMVAELRRNNAALLQLLSAIGAAMVNAETKTGADVRDAIVGALKEHAEVVKAEGRQARNNPKAA